MNRKISLFVAILAVLLCQTFATAQASLGSKPVLTLEAARGVTMAAEKVAASNHWAMVVAIVDDGGNLLLLERMDGAHLGSIEIALKKAKTAALFNAPSKVFGDGLASTPALMKLDVLPFEGGIPLIVQGKQIGSIGVSGGDTADMDGKVAQAGVDWLRSETRK